ncbi:hypothetical protein PENSTE_c021G07744 [Penicillium steckii]|uniref:histidine kinase n=1 Tax=Penicillium steckii TaxID=303698 RepID=A0A1V6SU93_9EURO|nr:hypothetical protein PENSTE_c021G07744 [Penicillium steckii]
MDLAGSLAYHPRPSNSERERIRELSRYYCCTHQQSPSPFATTVDETLSSIEAPTGDEQPSSGVLSTDITLTALSQLGVLRLGCNRSFVSIIDGDNQHIIAEATGSISLRNVDKHDPDDGIYLGARSLDLVWGVCPHTIRLFTSEDQTYEVDTQNVTANRTRYIIRDFTKEDCFKDRPYVVDWPHMRFYAEVPLTSPAGYVLGSYCVVGDQPREEFSDEEIDILQEISDAIANHLENKRIAHYHSRFERLVTGLTDFSKDHPGIELRGSANSPSESENSTIQGCAIPASSASADILSNESSPDEDSGVNGADSTTVSTRTQPKSPSFPKDSSSSTEPTSLYSNLSLGRPTPGEERSLESIDEAFDLATRIAPKDQSAASFSENVSTADRVRSIFSRASSLLRNAMDLDGVLFLDASRSKASYVPSRSNDWEPLPKTANQGDDISTYLGPLFSEGNQQSQAECEVLGQALRHQSQDSSTTKNELTLDEESLEELVKTCPQGQVLDICSGGADTTSLDTQHDNKDASSSIVAQILVPLLPRAKSLVWLPLRDHQKSRWMAGMLSWSSDSQRGLGVEELHYFKVFADSIVSEVSRVNWISTEKSKFDLLSSLSHELRSPLHGILASAELLHGTRVDAGQEDMVKMIEQSGLNLLETTDHLLTYCKINNTNRAKTSNVKDQQNNPLLVLETDFDLGCLVEEVTNILYTGQKDPNLATRPYLSSTSRTAPDTTDSAFENASVVVRIDKSQSWMIRSLSGAWRRIIMNILGNSLKWTPRGLIEISLSKLRNREESGGHLAQISVIDTGRGISPDFLKHDLFTPFTQEDRLVEGVGLGLSIVHQLVNSLNGHINVRSELGLGTQVDVFIPVNQLEDDRPTAEESMTVVPHDEQQLQVSLVAFNGLPDIKETPTGMFTVEAKRKLSIQSILLDVFMSSPGWTVSLADSLENGQGDVAVLESSTIEQMTEPISLASIVSTSGFKFIIILKNKPSILEKTPIPNCFWVSPPFGPNKIQNAVQKALRLYHSSVFFEEILSPSNPNPPIQVIPDVSNVPATSVRTAPESDIAIRPSSSVPSSEEKTDQERRHVLVVDDNDINLKIMATFMRKLGCTYETASNGLIALEKYKSCDRRFDYVLMDISMPVMDGLVSTDLIRNFEKENGLKPSSIMAVTGVASDAMHQQALAAGVDKYLIKPLSLRELKKIII